MKILIEELRNGRKKFPGCFALSLPFMETAFYILIYLKTPKGFESFGKFYIGDNGELARKLFQKLKGSDERVTECALQIDLMETRNHLPVNIKVIGCTLEELGDNCKIITKETFKMFAL